MTVLYCVRMKPSLGALVIFTADLDSTVAFYRRLGVPLEVDDHHDGGPVHYAAELGDCHFAVFPAEAGPGAPGFREAGGTFPGFAVEDVEAVLAAAAAAGVEIVQPLARYPWGRRAVITDPDGRPVEVYTP